MYLLASDSLCLHTVIKIDHISEVEQMFLSRKVCPVCDSSSHITLIELDHNCSKLRPLFMRRKIPLAILEEHKYIYKVRKCLQCNFLFQVNIPNDIFSNLLYSEIIGKRKKKYIDDPNFNPNNKKQTIKYFHDLNMAHKLCGNEKSFSVLDFGSGWGGYSIVAELMGFKSYGCEISKPQIGYSKNKGIKLTTLDEIELHKFDFINSEQVFEHINQPKYIFSKLLNRLNPGGVIRLSVPNSGKIERLLKSDWEANQFWAKGASDSLNPVEPLQHINSFTYEPLKYFGESFKLQEIKQAHLTILKYPIKEIYFSELLIRLMRNVRNMLVGSTEIYFTRPEEN